jgi:DNA repair exonuclease SbcCD ATPase subunit
MDGNRGAKGSIKDRLISMLYRLRYAKKVKKEDEYSIAKKEKQVEYLRKLVDLKENENIDILESSDKNELDKVKFTATYKLNDGKFTLDKKGIGEVELNLTDIEYKTGELDEKVEIKEEIKKTENEVVILKEVDAFIKKSKENLEEIRIEVESLKELSKEKNQDTKELEERYKKLREKVDKLKAQYDAVKEKYDLSEFSILESIKLIDNIKDYKNRASLNEMDMMIKVCKKEISKIESVTVEYKETKQVGSNIEEIKKDQNNIKIKFHKNKEDINKIKYTSEEITNELKTHEQIIEDMYKEAAYFEKVTRTELEYSGYGKMFSSLLKIAGGVLTLPFTGSKIFGVALGNTMINRGLRTLNKGLEVKQKVVIDYKYTDIAHKISEVKDKVEYTNLIISDNLNEISKLKENFKKYKEYNKVLPEYESMLEKVNKLEEKLKLQQEKISNMDKKLEDQKQINNEKMKKVIRLQDK